MITAAPQTRPGRELRAGRRTAATVVEKDNLARALGWFSLGLGTAQVVAPRAVERLIGVGDNATRRTVMRIVGLREIASGVGIVARPRPAGWLWARVAGDALDLALLAKAMTAQNVRSGRVAAAAGAVAGVMGPDLAAGVRLGRGGPTAGEKRLRVAQAATVNRPPDEVYAFWRDFDNLPRFMEHVESVRSAGERGSHWRVKAPLGTTVEWDAEIVEDRRGELIAWRTLPGAQVEHSGRVSFRAAPGGRGTEVHAELEYAPPGRAAAATLAKLLGAEPEAQAYDDLRRFKQVLETGELVRSEGTPGGGSLVQHLLQRAAHPLGREPQTAGH